MVKKNKEAQFALSAAMHDSMVKQVKKLVHSHADLQHYVLDEKTLGMYLEAIKGEKMGLPLSTLLKRSHTSQAAKAGAVISRASADGFVLTKRKDKADRGHGNARSNSAPAARTQHSKPETTLEGLDLYQPTVAQFQQAGDDQLNVIRSRSELIPGARGVLLTNGAAFMDVFTDKKEMFKQYGETLVALLPAGKFEKHLCNNAELHAELQPQLVQIVAIDPITKGGYRPLSVWAISMSKQPLKIKSANANMKVKVDKLVSLVLQVKKGVVPPEAYDAL